MPSFNQSKAFGASHHQGFCIIVYKSQNISFVLSQGTLLSSTNVFRVFSQLLGYSLYFVSTKLHVPSSFCVIHVIPLVRLNTTILTFKLLDI